MLDCQQKEIDGQVFSVEMLDSKSARAAFVRLTRILGPSLSALAKSKETNLLNIDHSIALDALSQLFASMSEEDLEFFCDKFRAKTKIPVAGTYGPLPDAIFAGKMTLLFKWLWFCLEVNYSDFLAVFRDMKLPTSNPTASPSPSPQG